MSVPRREQIDPVYRWNLSPLFPSMREWERGMTRVEELLPQVEAFRGRLEESAITLCAAFEYKDRIEKSLQAVYYYARMRSAEDLTDDVWRGCVDRASSLAAEVLTAVSFVKPEILSMSPGSLETFFDQHEPLRLYRKTVERIMRLKAHVQEPAIERMLAGVAPWAEVGTSGHSLLLYADLTFEPVTDAEGREHPVNEFSFRRLLESADRQLRQRACHSLLGTYHGVKHTLSELFKANVKKQAFYSQVRGYSSCLERALDLDEIPQPVYETMLQGVHEGIEALHEYLELRKSQLGLEKLEYCDLYVPLVKDVAFSFSYQEAQDLILAAMAPLGEDYVRNIQRCFDERWIDVYPNAGKSGGARTYSVYSSNPFVLLNYNGQLDDLFTLAHELGHAMHFVYTNAAQPYVYSNVSAFVGEVAAMVHEHLLLHYLQATIRDESQTKVLLQHELELGRGLFFRQAMLAEFESRMYELHQTESLSVEQMCTEYGHLHNRYYGPSFQVDEWVKIEWARIPQLFKSFYVYKYVTGYTAAVVLAEHVLMGGSEASGRFLRLLSDGNRTDPIDQLQLAGVDLLSVAPYRKAIQLFRKSLEQLLS
ncbi:MAG TPA: oligoendopeptidase F [Bacilli bacterium]|nr:oligoendopeptidase F [Bacilli bacterium]